MANILLYLTHPNPESLNAAAANALHEQLKNQGHTVRFKDLYRTDFDPVLGGEDFAAWEKGSVPDAVAKEQEDITWADALAFVYPIWWNERPAKLKGYIDRVFTHGFAFAYGEKGVIGKLKGKRAFVAVTYGSPEALYDGLNISKENLASSMKKGTLNFCGIEEVEFVETFGILTTPDGSKPKEHLEKVETAAKKFFG